MPSQRYLTKSRFKTAYPCARKLYYLDRHEYGNNQRENEFLEALAQGGFQVGALAKIQYADGIDLEDLESTIAIQRTNELLKQENVTLFEAAISIDHYLVRVDILVKTGNTIRIIEAKAKGFSENKDEMMRKDGKGVQSIWEPYLIDITFQTWVAHKLLPQFKIESSLLLVNKEAIATVDQLHQNFKIINLQGRSRVEIRKGTNKNTIGQPLLMEIDVADEIDFLMNKKTFPGSLGFSEFAESLATHLTNESIPPKNIGNACKNCEFRISKELKMSGKKSGFEQCWIEDGKLTPAQLDEKLIFDIWNFKNTEKMISEGKYFIHDLEEEDLASKGKLSKTAERQWLQIQKVKTHDSTPFLDLNGIKTAFSKFKYPLHFIDFETSMVAIPFHQGRRPYEQIAFQFSHHTLDRDGQVRHADEFIHFTPGEFPNFDFVRKLKKSLSNDDGTIFRYADHENTVLRQIMSQIESLPPGLALPDTDELVEFIQSITRPKDGEPGSPGLRCMIDLKKIITDYYYHPLMGGSNSIKKVIPAMMGTSSFLQKKYPKWATNDPYQLLKPVFQDIPQDTFDVDSPLFTDESIDDGGAAMTAWARMQFTEMKPIERNAIVESLLRYCELDTLSMVWIIEYLGHEAGLT
jgi:hypothetical protein